MGYLSPPDTSTRFDRPPCSCATCAGRLPVQHYTAFLKPLFFRIRFPRGEFVDFSRNGVENKMRIVRPRFTKCKDLSGRLGWRPEHRSLTHSLKNRWHNPKSTHEPTRKYLLKTNSNPPPQVVKSVEVHGRALPLFLPPAGFLEQLASAVFCGPLGYPCPAFSSKI